MDKDGRWTLEDVYNDIGGRDEIRRALNVGHDRMHRWLWRSELIGTPKPIRTLRRFHLYSIVEWEAWYDRWIHMDNHKWMLERPTVGHADGRKFFTYDFKDG